MNALARKCIFGTRPNTVQNLVVCGSDVFSASVINQKIVNQSAQQVLVLIVAQVLSVIEAQFGFATNDDSDTIVA
jgi:hypothetical protein